jgi:tetratricopeptide (TPR) repeat protein
LLERLAEEHPAAPEYQRRLLHAWTAMQVAYHNLRQPMDSLAIFEKAKPVADKLAQVHPDVPEYRSMARQLEVLYGGALSQLGDYRKAVEAVESAMVDSPGGGILYNAACTYALAAASVRDDKNLDAAERELIRKKYQDRAMELLIKVESLGWFAGGSAAESLTNDHDFDILRDRQDFQNLLTNVQSRLGSSVSNQSID